MVEEREDDNPERVVDPNENTDKDKVTLDSTDSEMSVIDPPENQPPGSK